MRVMDEVRGLSQRIADAFERGRTRWPAISIAHGAFARFVEVRVSPEPRWQPDELYLTCAVLAGDPRALAVFDAEYLAPLDRALARFADAALVEDTRQVVRERLLVASDIGEARLAAFTGRGALIKWVEVTAMRTAISLRRTARDIPTDDRTLTALCEPSSDPRTAYLATTYRAQFETAWRHALRSLDPADRTLLRLHVLDRVPVDRLGALYGVHATTAARRVRQVKDRLGEQVRHELQALLAVTSEELTSIVELIRSQVEVSLGGLLSSDGGMRDS